MHVETEQETDGRWIAEMPSVPGAMVYAPTRCEAVVKVEVPAQRILNESHRVECDGKK